MMKKLLISVLFLLLPPVCFAQVTGLQVVQRTSAQIVIGYHSSTDCTVAVAADDGSGSNLTPLVPDVNTALFANSNDAQTRYPALQQGNYQEFIIGTVTNDSQLSTTIGGYPGTASDGNNYSRALQDNTLYNIQVCGSAFIQAKTTEIPNGTTYGFVPPIGAGGNYLLPTLNFNPNETVIDPSNGELIKRLTGPVDMNYGTHSFSMTAGTCTNWTNPGNLTSTSVYATYATTTEDKCQAVVGSDTTLTGTNSEASGFQVSFQAFASVGTEPVKVCISFDKATCAGTVQSFTLTTSPSTFTLPTTVANMDTTWLPPSYKTGSTGTNGVSSNPNFSLRFCPGVRKQP
jgi:hypothetical protein